MRRRLTGTGAYLHLRGMPKVTLTRRWYHGPAHAASCQIMPRTANAYGLPASQITNPEANIKTAVAIIKDLDNSLKKHVPDPTERRKFVLAAYNSGIAHIYDAIALAKKYGKNPQVWSGNVEEALLMKANPEYYNDPVCKFGYFRGRQTTQYVIKVLDFYERCRKQIAV